MKTSKPTVQSALCSVLIFLFGFLVSCNAGDSNKPFVDNTLNRRQKAKEIIENAPPEKQLMLCSQFMYKNDGYGLFYNSHKKMFEAMANAPEAQRASIVGTHIFENRFSKGKECPITIKEIQNTRDFTKIKEKALKLGLINKTALETLPDSELVPVLFLDADLRKEYEGDSLYVLFRRLLLGQRGDERSIGSEMNLKKKTVSAVPDGKQEYNPQKIVGGRSRSNIMRTVRNNMSSLRSAYAQRVSEYPGLKGNVTVMWVIDEFGNVLFARVVSGTMKDPVFRKELVRKIKTWSFGKIPIPGDATEVTYSFVF